MSGRWSHPRSLRRPRKMSSTGSVTQRRVIMTSLLEGCAGVEADDERGRERAVVWRYVERRDTNMEPTLPGRPRTNSLTVASQVDKW